MYSSHVLTIGFLPCYFYCISFLWSSSDSLLEMIHLCSFHVGQKKSAWKCKLPLLFSGVTCLRLHHLRRKMEVPTGFLQAGSRRELTLISKYDSAGAYDKDWQWQSWCIMWMRYICCHALIKGCRRYETVGWLWWFSLAWGGWDVIKPAQNETSHLQE